MLTLHEVRRDPSPTERDVIVRLVGAAGSVVVLSAAAAAALVGDYGVAPDRIDVIPAGVPDTPIVDPAPGKALVGAADREIVLGIGLLAPRKGFERVIEALPGIVGSHPAVLFAVVGATHPDVRARDGEAYRQALAARAAALGVAGNVRFVDEFVGRVELTRWLQAADIVVTPYTDLATTCSGILAHAMAAGRPVVATRFPHAVDVLADDCGLLLAGEPGAMERAVLGLLDDPALRARLGARAHERSREWAWSKVGAAHHHRLARGAPALAGG